MPSEAQLTPDSDLPMQLAKRVKRLLVWVVVIAVWSVASSASLFYIFHQKAKAIEKAQKELQWTQFVYGYLQNQDFVTPEVNTIQFLKRGFSVDFDSVQYTQDGLVLSGTIGNQTELWVSALAVNFTARPWPQNIRDKWGEKHSVWWDADWDIGKGQTTVGNLNPGASVPFRAMIPNVKQTPNGIHIAVTFSGERYQYVGK